MLVASDKIRLSWNDGEILGRIVRYHKLYANDKELADRTLAQLMDEQAKKIYYIIFDLLDGIDVPESPERKYALRMITATFSWHASSRAHRKNRKGILTCGCGYTLLREILRKYGELEKIAAYL